MTMTIDRPARRTSSGSPAQRLRNTFAAVRVNFTWFGVRKTINSEQKAQAAEQFGAEGQYLTAAKKLLDTKHQAFPAGDGHTLADPQLLEGAVPALSRAGCAADPPGGCGDF